MAAAAAAAAPAAEHMVGDEGPLLTEEEAAAAAEALRTAGADARDAAAARARAGVFWDEGRDEYYEMRAAEKEKPVAFASAVENMFPEGTAGARKTSKTVVKMENVLHRVLEKVFNALSTARAILNVVGAAAVPSVSMPPFMPAAPRAAAGGAEAMDEGEEAVPEPERVRTMEYEAHHAMVASWEDEIYARELEAVQDAYADKLLDTVFGVCAYLALTGFAMTRARATYMEEYQTSALTWERSAYRLDAYADATQTAVGAALSLAEDMGTQIPATGSAWTSLVANVDALLWSSAMNVWSILRNGVIYATFHDPTPVQWLYAYQGLQELLEVHEIRLPEHDEARAIAEALRDIQAVSDAEAAVVAENTPENMHDLQVSVMRLIDGGRENENVARAGERFTQAMPDFDAAMQAAIAAVKDAFSEMIGGTAAIITAENNIADTITERAITSAAAQGARGDVREGEMRAEITREADDLGDLLGALNQMDAARDAEIIASVVLEMKSMLARITLLLKRVSVISVGSEWPTNAYDILVNVAAYEGDELLRGAARTALAQVRSGWHDMYTYTGYREEDLAFNWRKWFLLRVYFRIANALRNSIEDAAAGITLTHVLGSEDNAPVYFRHTDYAVAERRVVAHAMYVVEMVRRSIKMAGREPALQRDMHKTTKTIAADWPEAHGGVRFPAAYVEDRNSLLNVLHTSGTAEEIPALDALTVLDTRPGSITRNFAFGTIISRTYTISNHALVAMANREISLQYLIARFWSVGSACSAAAAVKRYVGGDYSVRTLIAVATMHYVNRIELELVPFEMTLFLHNFQMVVRVPRELRPLAFVACMRLVVQMHMSRLQRLPSGVLNLVPHVMYAAYTTRHCVDLLRGAADRLTERNVRILKQWITYLYNFHVIISARFNAARERNPYVVFSVDRLAHIRTYEHILGTPSERALIARYMRACIGLSLFQRANAADLRAEGTMLEDFSRRLAPRHLVFEPLKPFAVRTEAFVTKGMMDAILRKISAVFPATDFVRNSVVVDVDTFVV